MVGGYSAIAQHRYRVKRKKTNVNSVAIQDTTASKPAEKHPMSGKPDAAIGAKLIPFSVLTANSKVFSHLDIPKGNKLIFMMFNPGCGHCIATTNAIKNNIDSFKHTTILLVTGNALWSHLQEFINEVQLPANTPIIVAAELGDITQKLFEYEGIPQVMVYNEQHILVSKMFKEIDIQELIRLTR